MNSKLRIKNLKLIPRAFTLVELMIVVSILGILAAIVYPEFQNHIQQAKEAQAKANLKLLRDTIERYYVDHGAPPGYPNNDPTQTPGNLFVISQLTTVYKYISKLPKNPFNGHSGFYVVQDGQAITDGMAADSAQGWVYQPSTRTVKLNTTGTDSEGKQFFDY